MKLHWSPRSPFVRKVMVAAHELGLAEKIECVRSVVGDEQTQPRDHAATIRSSKIPTLVLGDGTVLFDSPSSANISTASPEAAGCFAPAGRQRWLALTPSRARQRPARPARALAQRARQAGRPADARVARRLRPQGRRHARPPRRRRPGALEASRSGSGTSRSAVRSPIWISALPISAGATGRPRLAAWHEPLLRHARRPGRRRSSMVEAAHPRTRSTDAHPRARPRAHHGGALGDANSRRSRRRRHQGRAAGRGRRHARLGPAVPQGPGRQATAESRLFPLGQSRQAIRRRRHGEAARARNRSAAWRSNATW